MSSSLCHGLQTCLEPRQVGPRVLRLKLTPHGPTADSDAAGKMKMGTTQLGTDAADWSFLHAFAYAEEKCEGEQGAVYVHPLLKCSASFLSDRSLEMCTESLGSETGSDVSDGEAPLLSPGGGADRRLVVRSARKKLSRSSSFPPPLTSVGGSTGVQVRSRREGGRVVVEAVGVSSPHHFFQVERSHGHLRVRFLEESDAPETEAEEEEEDEEVESESEEQEEEEEEEEEEETMTVEGEDFDYEECEEEEGEGMEGNSGFVRGEIGKRKCLKPSMSCCKEGAATNWNPKPCWVVT
ncbi:hypothetical protein EUGRSUZ_H01485 [Eucalyptus grandis]|uniref:Uncharacterized protein n=2 Tax=Eucalyptus grandis TaxID=71139 RepID=A0ACC3JNV8_EUCGR|nr:hypothetical protein EUGRSUZ_H01485 [Eucalyptus grandis]